MKTVDLEILFNNMEHAINSADWDEAEEISDMIHDMEEHGLRLTEKQEQRWLDLTIKITTRSK